MKVELRPCRNIFQISSKNMIVSFELNNLKQPKSLSISNHFRVRLRLVSTLYERSTFLKSGCVICCCCGCTAVEAIGGAIPQNFSTFATKTNFCHNSVQNTEREQRRKMDASILKNCKRNIFTSA